MKNAGMHRLAPFMFGLYHVFLAVFSRHFLSTASPRALQAQSCAGRARAGGVVGVSYREHLLHSGE